MTHDHGETPPLVKKERRKGLFLTLVALALLLLVALFILVEDEIFSAAPPEETNLVIHTGEE